MKLIFRSMRPYAGLIVLTVFIKLLGTLAELLLPYIFEHIIDHVVPKGSLPEVLFFGFSMFLAAILTRFLNVTANRSAINNAHHISYDIRQALFEKTMNLSGPAFDAFGLPSLISRMTSDSYNVQSAAQQFQTLCVRAPIMLIGGVLVTLLMDRHLALILIVMLPFLIAVILFVSSKGIPMYSVVQQKLDNIVRIMRESITGIRVIKALTKEDHEIHRFADANKEMADSDINAATLMAVPGPLMQLCLNTGLAAVVYYGAYRVNEGLMQPGVILAFLTYFNMIAMGVMGLSRIFMTLSKASASADRIALVLDAPSGGRASVPEAPADAQDDPDAPFIAFDHVSFSYGEDSSDTSGFHGETRERALSDISFSLGKGESLGIIGPTGCGKTTVINLLLRFYDTDEGTVLVGGRDVRTYDPDLLRKRFGSAFQNDIIFRDSLYENIRFGREASDEDIRRSVENAQAAEFIDSLPDGLQYEAAIKGANLSGGQKQRILVARALAGHPDILILDDSSSALDYRTDANMRKAILHDHPDTTLIMVAQRVSSVMNMTKILVLDNGRCVGYGTHEELLKTCPSYLETYEIQMGALA